MHSDVCTHNYKKARENSHLSKYDFYGEKRIPHTSIGYTNLCLNFERYDFNSPSKSRALPLLGLR